MYLTDTLDDPKIEGVDIPMFLEAISKSRAAANAVKRQEPVVVVIGNRRPVLVVSAR